MCPASKTNGRSSTSSQPSAHAVNASQAAKFLACVGGIYTAYLTQGYVAEQLAKSRYGEDQESFVHLPSLVGFQCICCFLFAGFLWLVLESRRSTDFPPAYRYAWLGVTNVVGPSCGMLALKNITYPAQVLAKSCKSVPIMITGALLYGKRYKTLEYVSAAFIGIGVGLFAILGNTKHRGVSQDMNPLLGYALVFVNLGFDSFTNAAQDEINRTYPKNSALHMMCWTNFWGGLYYAAYLFLLSSTGSDVIYFALQHSEALLHVLAFCLCGACGQLFIFYTIATQGSLICSLVCTTRKFFSILLSVLLAGSVISASQWGAVVLVFIGLLYKSFIRLWPKRVKQV